MRRAIPADNAGGTVGSNCGGGMGKDGGCCAGSAGWLVHSEGQHGAELGCLVRIVIGRRLDEERGRLHEERELGCV